MEAERTVVTVFSNVALSGALASNQAFTADGTPLEAPGCAITLPNVASAPWQAAVWRAARTGLPYGRSGAFLFANLAAPPRAARPPPTSRPPPRRPIPPARPPAAPPGGHPPPPPARRS